MGNEESSNEFEENFFLNNQNLTELSLTPYQENIIKRLYLSFNRINNLPKDMNELILMDLSSNKLGSSLPDQIVEALSSYQNLNTLNLNRNHLENLSNLQSSSLKVFYMNQNRFIQIPDQLFTKFPQLHSFYFDFNFLSALSNLASETVQTLSLSLNCIETIDLETVYFPQLVFLDLSKNRITRIPNNFSKSFPKLQTLNLNDNLISEISEINDDNESVFPETLTKLNLSNNLLEKLPNSITKIPYLQYLDIDKNKITHIPRMNTSLVEFKASNNKVSSIDDQDLLMLRDLILFNNELQTFPTQIKTFRVNSIKVARNEIKEINFESFPISKVLSAQITEVNLSFNQIETIPKELFENLPNLQTFSAFFNKITEIPSEISNCQNLTNLNISHNPIKKLPKLPDSLVKLTASNCQIESIDETLPKRLKFIDLSGNNLQSFTSFSSIQFLNLSQNKIAKMPAVTENMEILDLSMNELESTADSMPEYITCLTLVDLNLSFNKLTVMPGISLAPLLEYLEISGNPIKGEINISNLPCIKRIDISQTEVEITGTNDRLNAIITSARTDNYKTVYVNQEDVNKTGFSEFLGKRSSQEDSIIVRDDLNLYAVCDGHGGPDTSKAASIEIANIFEEEKENYSYENASDFVSEVVHKATDKIQQMKLEDGSTLCLALVCTDEYNYRRKVVTAHLGDSRALIVCSDGSARDLTRDHKASVRSEFERVHNDFGCVTKENRLDSVLQVTRSIGDYDVFGVEREPEMNEFDLSENDKFLVICCDGVFDVLTNEDVAKLIVNISSANEAAYAIRNAAFSALSSDNISAIVIDLKNIN